MFLAAMNIAIENAEALRRCSCDICAEIALMGVFDIVFLVFLSVCQSKFTIGAARPTARFPPTSRDTGRLGTPFPARMVGYAKYRNLPQYRLSKKGLPRPMRPCAEMKSKSRRHSPPYPCFDGKFERSARRPLASRIRRWPAWTFANWLPPAVNFRFPVARNLHCHRPARYAPRLAA